MCASLFGVAGRVGSSKWFVGYRVQVIDTCETDGAHISRVSLSDNCHSISQQLHPHRKNPVCALISIIYVSACRMVGRKIEIFQIKK
jgi:hypothetical protein